MDLIRRTVIGIAGVAVVALAMSLAAPRVVHAVVSTLVTVTNTPNVSVVNTPTVNVASLPAVQLSGNINANVTNPTNTNGSAIPLLTADVTARQSFSSFNSCKIQAFGCTMDVFPAVGNGLSLGLQTLVIESVTGYCYLDPGTSLQTAQLVGVAPAGNDEFVLDPIMSSTVPGNGINVQSYGENLKAYLTGSGATLNGVFQTSAYETVSSDFCSMTVSGYVVQP